MGEIQLGYKFFKVDWYSICLEFKMYVYIKCVFSLSYDGFKDRVKGLWNLSVVFVCFYVEVVLFGIRFLYLSKSDQLWVLG